MKKLNNYISIFSCCTLLFFTNAIFACAGRSWYEADQNIIFKVTDSMYIEAGNYGPTIFEEYLNKLQKTKSNQKNIKCEYWRIISNGYGATKKEIQDFLYNVPFDSAMSLLNSGNKVKNHFVYFLNCSPRQEFRDYIMLLKQYELTLKKHHSPWYYPTKKNKDTLSFEKIAQQCHSYTGKNLHDRYLLLEMKCQFQMHDYDNCITIWERNKNSIKTSFIKNDIYGLYLGAKFRENPSKEIIYEFSKNNDYKSMFFCSEIIERLDNTYTHNKYNLFAKYCIDNPTSEDILDILQILGICSICNNQLTEMQDMAEKVLAHKNVKNPAMWYYTIAVMEYYKYNCNPYTGFEYSNNNCTYKTIYSSKMYKLLRKAEQSEGNELIHSSINIFKFILENENPQTASENSLLHAMQYCDCAIKYTITPDAGLLTWNDSYNNIYFYYHKMLQKILLGKNLEKTLKEGNYVKALQMINVAENNMGIYIDEFNKSLSDTIETRHKYKTYNDYGKLIFWNTDYSTKLFRTLDTLPIQFVIEYVKRLEKPLSYMDTYTATRSYKNFDFFYDLIGTRYLRENNYKEAVTYLSKVSSDFQNKLNTKFYMTRDYFSARTNSKINDNTNYKLTFARKMYDLERKIESEKNPDKCADMMVQYAIGMGNSHRHCWALTKYSVSSGYELWDTYPLAKKIFNDAIKTYKNKNAAAQSLYNVQKYNEIRKNYTDTYIADYMHAHCDTKKDYVKQ
ncbi:MAG: hypothetical protein MJ197_08165 [Bacteroidales bacterium]|nr:hypothetical protein [Bacteroidales bacterium]